MATLKQVAQLAGVSLGTASKVLSGTGYVSDALKRRVEKARHELGYRPNFLARSLKTLQSRVLGLVISDITNPFFPLVLRGAEDAAMERGFVLTTFNTDDRVDREKHVIDILRMRQVEGILIVVALPKGDATHLQGALDDGIPIVCLDRIPEGPAVDSVTVDNEAGVHSAVAHLIQQGHRDIAYIGGRLDLFVSQDRKNGFLRAIREAGLKCRLEWVLEGDFRQESGHSLGLKLLSSSHRPTAVFVANVMMTLGVVRALEELNLSTPEDLALATFDHIQMMDGFRPHLTCVEQPSYEIGWQGANLLIDRIEDKSGKPPVHIQLNTSLQVRESTQTPLVRLPRNVKRA